MKNLLIIILIEHLFVETGGQCIWPTAFQSSTWRDSYKGDLMFGTTHMTGWSFDVQVQAGASAQTLNTWECVIHNDTFLVMKTNETFVQFVTNVYTGYRCLRLTKLTDNSYRYYEITPTHTNLGGIRLFISENSNLANFADVCYEQYQASGSEFKVMIKSGNEADAKINCPYNFLANHTYTYTDSSTANTCNPVTDTGTLDLCTNNTELAFTTPSCVTASFYSDAGPVWCLDVVPVGGDTFISMYNSQQNVNSIDDSNYFLFSCMGVNSGNTEISVTPNSCKAGQTTNSIPSDHLGTSIGHVLAIINTDVTCPPCPVLADPFRGNVSISTSGAVTTATYTCDSNFTLSGDSTRVCQSDGTWSGTAPSCACPILSDPTNGTVTTSSDGLTANFTCDVGTVIVGTVTVTCDTSTNTWSATSPTCNACQALTNPDNGTFQLTSDGLTSFATYSCVSGTTLNGVQVRTCQSNGGWDSVSPTCTYCSTLTDPDSGNVTITTNGSTSIATYYCASGYTLHGTNTSVCGTTGTWNAVQPTCRCDSPVSPQNGTVTLSSDFITATYTCDVGTSINGSSVRTCQTDGSGWSFTDPICVSCDNVTTIDNGTYSLSTNGTLTTLTYVCDVGTSLTGESTSYCGIDGTWSAGSPNCSVCDSFTEPSSGNYTLSTDGVITSATVACDVGTTLSGDVTVTCLENGTWSTVNTSINCVTCATLSPIVAGLGTLTSNGTSTSIQYTCAEGYGIVGNSTSTCQSDGTWTSTTPTCVSTPSTESESSSNLLPAVIVLAVLTVAFAVAFGILLYMYFRAKRENDAKSTPVEANAETSIRRQLTWKQEGYGQPYDVINDALVQLGTSKKVPLSKAPMDHQSHVIKSDQLSGSRAPSSFSFKDSFGVSEPVTPRSGVSSVTLPLHLIREATTSSILDQPVAPWHGSKAKSSKTSTPRTPRTPSDAGSNPRTPRKSRSSPRKGTENDFTTTDVVSLENSLDLRHEGEKTPVVSEQTEAKRRKKKKGILVRSNTRRAEVEAQAKQETDNDYDVPSVDIQDELNTSRRFYNSMYELLEKQESAIDKVLDRGTNSRDRRGVPNTTKTLNERLIRKNSTSPTARASTPVKHSMQIDDPQSGMTPRSNIISTVQ